jgi:hypothetical protein
VRICSFSQSSSASLINLIVIAEAIIAIVAPLLVAVTDTPQFVSSSRVIVAADRAKRLDVFGLLIAFDGFE